MRKVYLTILFAWASLSVLAGDMHVDELITVTVSGRAVCSPSCARDIELRLESVNRDRSAPLELARQAVNPAGGSFALTGGRLVDRGADEPSVTGDMIFQLVATSENCKQYRKTSPIRSFRKDKHGYLLDIGEVRLDCATQ